MKSLLCSLLILFLAACGARPEPLLDKEQIRRNAEAADQELNQESAEQQKSK